MFLKRISLLLLVGASGCTGMSKTFDCPQKPGVNCKSITEINTLVDGGLLPQKDCINGGCEKITHSALPSDSIPTQRLPIWLAPFEKNGIQYSDAYISVPIHLNETAFGESL